VSRLLHGRCSEKHKERWEKLCELAAKEQDPKKLMELANEIDRLFETIRFLLEEGLRWDLKTHRFTKRFRIAPLPLFAS
jgi:hypothetical protein